MEITRRIRTEQGRWVQATSVPGVGIVLEEMGGPRARRIILGRDAAMSLAQQLDLAALGTKADNQ